jgi:methylthioribulose-1-phosphate dehydratase
MNDYRNLICDLMAKFYNLGWCSGTGGGISIYNKDNETIYMAPSGVQKESLEPCDIFELHRNGTIKSSPINDLRLSECAPLFQILFDMRDAGAVLHSHALETVLIGRKFEKEFTITNMEMIKGITGHKNTDLLIVPIIENTEKESQLTERLKMAVLAYPNTYAVLVRNHGIYVWGENWKKAKQYAECYHYLFSASIRLMELGLNTD